MDMKGYLLLGLAFALALILFLTLKLHRVREQISFINDALEDLKGGNLNRRVLVQENDMTRQICYDINQIAAGSQSQLIHQRQSEQAYKRLMTSLSHDVKTPLASLVGYLEAQIIVADNGKGISADNLPHIFELLYTPTFVHYGNSYKKWRYSGNYTFTG